MLRLDVRRRAEPLRGVRQRHRAPGQPLEHKEQRGEAPGPAIGGCRQCDHALPTVCAVRPLRLAPRAYARSRRSIRRSCRIGSPPFGVSMILITRARRGSRMMRSEEHTSELQSQSNLVCRLLLEKKKQALTSQRVTNACIPMLALLLLWLRMIV